VLSRQGNCNTRCHLYTEVTVRNKVRFCMVLKYRSIGRNAVHGLTLLSPSATQRRSGLLWVQGRTGGRRLARSSVPSKMSSPLRARGSWRWVLFTCFCGISLCTLLLVTGNIARGLDVPSSRCLSFTQVCLHDMPLPADVPLVSL